MLRSVDPGPETPARKAHTEAFRAWLLTDTPETRERYVRARAAALAERAEANIEEHTDQIAWRNALSRRSEP
jgi:hypothetical protein